ncbi:MAG: hypothetical protein NTX50_15795 [Candidatus Sumerlaeota bacterium]|nr:hypothetical protein [Candidatus Sumerlaeota bacterium]
MHRLILISALLIAALPVWVQGQSASRDTTTSLRLPENLAPKARITANSEYSKDYVAKNVADGQIPEAGGKGDVGKAWCVQGNTHRNGAQLTFEWEQPVTVAEIVYYGRTAWFAEECWKDCEVYAGDASQPVARAQFQMAQGPQCIALAAPIQASKLILKFTSSYSGFNPGASEIQIFASHPAPEALGKLVALKPGAPAPAPQAADKEIVEDPEAQPLRKALLDGSFGFRSLLVIQRRELNPTHVYTYHVEGFQAGGGLYLFTPGDKDKEGDLKKLVDSSQGQILDCSLSFDAKRVLFSWRKSTSETYHIFTINPDGSGLKQLTNDAWHDFNACWLQDGGIAFLSTRKPQFAYCWTSPVGTLYRMNADGSNVVRLSANYLNDFTPSVLNDGRIIYSRWEYVDRPAIPIQSLWTLNPDGTSLRVFYGNRVLSPATFMEPRAIPGSQKILCLMTAHNGPCRGAIGVLDPSRGVNAQEAIQNLTPEVDIGKVDQGNGNHIRGPYESPFPIDQTHFLVSKLGTILLRDFEGAAQCALLKPRDGIGFYSPMPVRSQPVPPARAATLPEKAEPWATIYLQDVYRGLEPQVKRGEVVELCVVQEIEKGQFADVGRRVFGFQFPVVSCGATYAPKKVWGYVPVAKDGSARFKAPAGVPLYFMALDKMGRAVQRMRSFTHFMPGEVQGCVGCHEPRDQAPERIARPVAMQSGSDTDIKPPRAPEWGLTGFSYAHVVQPVFDRNCGGCHNAADTPKGVDLSGDKTDFFNVSYEILARKGTAAMNAETGGASPRSFGANLYTSWIPTYNGMESDILVIAPKSWGSPASKLADLIITGHPDKEGNLRSELKDNERRRILAWIDLNVPYYGTSLSSHHDRKGCRQMLPDGWDEALQKVAERRCASCHKPDAKGKIQIPRAFYMRITNPENNNVFVAPLSKFFGGTEACGKAVFANKEDPDYKALLALFDPLSKQMKEKPREDMLSYEEILRNETCPKVNAAAQIEREH